MAAAPVAAADFVSEKAEVFILTPVPNYSLLKENNEHESDDDDCGKSPLRAQQSSYLRRLSR